MIPGIAKFLVRVLGFALSAILLVGCEHEQPNTIYMPDMVYSPAFKAQEPESMRMPVKGTVPRGYQAYQFAKNTPDEVSRALKNPVRRTAAVLERGQDRYNIYCSVCHGPVGDGDGSVSGKFPRPPSLHSDKVAGQWGDGAIYHVITMGQNAMPPYASQLDPDDRWAIVHYIRALQKSKKPTPEDVRAAESGS